MQLALKEHPPCHAPESTTSPSHSTASPRARVRVWNHRSVMRANGCTSGCSPPASATRCSARTAGAAASTTRSPSATAPASAPRSWAPASSARPEWQDDRRRVARLVGAEPAVPHADVRPHPPPRPSIEMEGGTTFHFLDATPAEALDASPEGRRRPGRAHRRRPDGRPRLPRRRAHRPPARRAGPDRARPRAFDCGTGWKAWRTTTRSRPRPRPAASPT